MKKIEYNEFDEEVESPKLVSYVLHYPRYADQLLHQEVEGWVDERVEEVEELDNQQVELVDELLIKIVKETRGREVRVGMTWEDFKALMREVFCPKNKMQKLEIEFWCHAMVKAGHAMYNDRFHELARQVPHLVTPENKRVERYIYGLALQIRAMVAATLNRAPGQGGNRPNQAMAIEGGQGRGNNGERTEEKVRHLMILRAKRQKLKDIVVVRNFSMVFPVDLSGLPPPREIKFHIDLIPKQCRSQNLPTAWHPLKWRSCRAKSENSRTRVLFCQVHRHGEHRYYLGKVIAYASRQLKIHEKNYTTYDLELGAVVFALKIHIHYLYEMKSVIYTDHKSLWHIFNKKELNMRQRHWIELFSDCDGKIRYHPGKANVVVDAISRKEIIKPKRVQAMNMTTQSSIKDKILAAQNEASKTINAPTKIL
uniref:Putative reverse transcriptase domain-containing protein n=1 Tax=Tanacetum cinerariifolium TaxID=118510 RepID=A0A6L2L4Q8_TANCI|nr:putative reverse transcriptase domain-containing protein [Tanacetum cinerariifolium]